MPRFPLGVNVEGLGSGGIHTWDSPDIMMCASSAHMPRIQTTLAAPYVGGSGVMRLAGANPFTIDAQNGTIIRNLPASLNTTAGAVSLTLTAVAGSPWVYITSWAVPAQDVNYAAGTYVNHNRNGFANASKVPADWPVRPELVVSGRRTGYPSGLGGGQAFIVSVNSHLASQAGNYTVLASGTGSIRFTILTAAGQFAYQFIAVAAGVASGPVVVAAGALIYQVAFVGSSDADPLHDVRAICPDRVGHADNFVATYRANASNPKYILFHPDFINSLRPFSILRFMDLMFTNNNPMVLDWADRPTWDGVCQGIGLVPPYEYLAELANQVGADSWWCAPITATDDWVTNFATFARDNINPALKVAVELGNEVWNSVFNQYYIAGRMSVPILSPASPQSIAYAGGTCTVAMTAHGFANGATIQVENCSDDGYNGAHVIAVVDANNFTYVPTTAPQSSPAVARVMHGIYCLDPGSQWYLPLASVSFDGKGTVTFTAAAPHNLGFRDAVQSCNAADPAYNGQWGVTVLDATRFAVGFAGDGYNRAMPAAFGPGAAAVAAKTGQSLRVWKIAHGPGPEPGGIPYSLSPVSFARRSAEIHAAVHATFTAAGQESRLINILAWQMPFSPTSWQFDGLIDNYLTYLGLGGGFLPNCETALSCAPYLLKSGSNAAYLGVPKAITALTSAGGVATATVAAHGYQVGDPVQVANILQPQYCGMFTVASVPDVNTFTYAVPGSPASPAAGAGGSIGGMVATKAPPYTREVTAISVSGATMTCTSPGHGWTTGKAIHFAPNPGGPTNPRNPTPALYGLSSIAVLDADTFTAPLPNSGPYKIPAAANRAWAWDDAALAVLDADLSALTILSTQFAGATATLDRYPGTTLRCYEGGNDFDINPRFPAGFDMAKAYQLSQFDYDLYTNYITQMYTTYRVTTWIQFNHIFYWSSGGLWGAKEWQHQPNTPEWLAMMALCAGVPDYTDGGGPPPPGPPQGAGPRRWFTGRARPAVGVGGPGRA